MGAEHRRLSPLPAQAAPSLPSPAHPRVLGCAQKGTRGVFNTTLTPASFFQPVLFLDISHMRLFPGSPFSGGHQHCGIFPPGQPSHPALPPHKTQLSAQILVAPSRGPELEEGTEAGPL